MNYKFLVLSINVILFIICSWDYTTAKPNLDKTSVTIGTQVWMTKNLDVDHYRNGDSIPEVKDPDKWAKLTTGAWCYYNNDPAMGAIYGKLYNWFAINDSRGLAPDGWHVPSNAEWTTLSTYLGGESVGGGYSVAGGKLKEAGTTHWQSPNTGATNETNFLALPGGYRFYNGRFDDIGGGGDWWSSTKGHTASAWSWYLSYGSSDLHRCGNYKVGGCAVRCIKD